MVVHHIPPPGKSLDSHCTLCSFYIFCQYKTIVPFCQQKFLETELGEVLNGKEIYLNSDRGTQLVFWQKTARDATDTQPLSEKWPRDAPSKPR